MDGRADTDRGLEVIDLVKEYRAAAGSIPVLDGISFRLAPGEALAILGPSGSGKSTLLFILGALEPPTRGAVRLDGIDPLSLGDRELAEFRNRRVGFVFQEHHLLPQLTLLENVLVPILARAGGPRAEDLERARALVERVGLGARAGHYPAQLSGGERQRTAIARALVGRPALVLADEPTGSLDQRSAAEVADLLLGIQRDERAILVLATHSAELAARFPRRGLLADGRLVTVTVPKS